MPIIKIPDSLKAFFRNEGIDDLSTILEFLETVTPVFIINASNYPTPTFLGGKIVDNFVELGAVDDATIKCPTGKRWILFGGTAQVDTDGSLDVSLYNEKDGLIGLLGYSASGVKNVYYGYGKVNEYSHCPLPMKAGWYLKFAWGATQTSPAISAIVVEMDV